MLGETAVRLAMIATTVVGLPTAGIWSCPATVIRRLRLVPMSPLVHDVDATRVSQILVGASAWYWYPAGLTGAVALPNQPSASMSTLMLPAELKTQMELSGPPLVAGPSATMTRFACTAPDARLTVEVPV